MHDHVGLVRIVRVNREGDAPREQAIRVMQELGAQQVIICFKGALGREHLQPGHLSSYAYNREIVNAVEAIVVQLEHVQVRAASLEKHDERVAEASQPVVTQIQVLHLGVLRVGQIEQVGVEETTRVQAQVLERLLHAR